jgi:hypothetical protein
MVGRKGEAPTTARLKTEPISTATALSNADAIPKDRLPDIRKKINATIKTTTARTLICKTSRRSLPQIASIINCKNLKVFPKK